jgi:hypothetical protein
MPAFPTDLSGKRFGSLTVIKLHGRYGRQKSWRWLARCDCGNEQAIFTGNLTNGRTKHCLKCSFKKRSIHGFVRKTEGYSCERSTWHAWATMKQRCLNSNHRSYKNYGGRGIKICRRWLRFENFLLDMGVKPSKELSLDRIDNERGYHPGNCRWTTRKVQNNNMRGRGLKIDG